MEGNSLRQKIVDFVYEIVAFLVDKRNSIVPSGGRDYFRVEVLVDSSRSREVGEIYFVAHYKKGEIKTFISISPDHPLS